jgi:hypothetical protein
LKSIAEIVETPKAANDLKRMGCDFAQGYFFSHPLAAEEALQLLRRPESSPQERSRVPTEVLAEDNSPTLMIPEESLRIMEETMIMQKPGFAVPAGPAFKDDATQQQSDAAGRKRTPSSNLRR